MKEFPNESKNKWTRIFKKKWFFPALYIVLAAFLLSAVVWYQNMQSQMFDGLDDMENTNQQDDLQSDRFDEEAKSVVQQEEIIKMPVEEEAQTEIVTSFFDYNAEEEEQEKGLVFYNNQYYQSTGVDIAQNDGEVFDVTASMSGKVDEVKEDPLHGNVVVLNHGDDISTYYASLEEVEVEEGDTVKQGDALATAGKNLFSEESGNHVHFELQKAGTELNPEDFFNQSLTALKEVDVEDEDDSLKETEEQEESERGVNDETNEDEELKNEDNEEIEDDTNEDSEEDEQEENANEEEEEETALSFSLII